MTRLLVRDLEPEVVQALKRRAVQHGRSAEAEHREILKQALLGPNIRCQLPWPVRVNYPGRLS